MTVQSVLLRIPQHADITIPERVRRQSDYARRALRHCARLCGAPEGGWQQNADGAPLPQAGYHWSISHKRVWAAAVIADTPVGIDIERIAARPRELHDKLAASGEWDLMGDRSWDAFFRLWTAKEATLKANGVGIGYLRECRLIEVVNDHHMVMKYDRRTWPVEHRRHEDHIAAVAVRPYGSIRWDVCANDGD